MRPDVLNPKDVQPLATGELRATPPHDITVPEPPPGRNGPEHAASSRAGRGQCEAEMAGDLLKVKRWAEEVGGPERLKELCDVLLRLRA